MSHYTSKLVVLRRAGDARDPYVSHGDFKGLTGWSGEYILKPLRTRTGFLEKVAFANP
jgi:hypothetical protein